MVKLGAAEDAIEAVLPPAEQVPGEVYAHGMRLKCRVISVARGQRGAQITVSRTHPDLVRGLFALEVPEVADGSVEISALAREAGHRTKIAVRSKVPGLNPKGACIGPVGSRVRNVTTELHGEKIDIVDFSDDPATFIASALSPSRVTSVEVVDPVQRAARVVVPDYQLSLAIGKEGQNARLAARLTGWRIDIHSDTEGESGAARRARRAVELDVARRSSPVRTCVGCRERAAQTALLRVVAVEDRLVPDLARRLPGRGASVHPDPRCLDLADKRRAFPRALRLAGPLDLSLVRAAVAQLHEPSTSQQVPPQRAETHELPMSQL